MKKSSQGDGEFSLIERYFYRTDTYHPETILGIGDDASLLQIPSGKQLVVSIDTMVEGVHFMGGVSPESLGHKLMAVNLSDLAAMGAAPVWATLALTIPENNPEWMGRFSQGMFALANHYQIDLVGGDTTRGPLTLTMQIHGLVPEGEAVRRDGAKAGDLICVTNSLGAAALALKLIQQGENAKEIINYLELPTPRVEAGVILREYATSMIDISDGLLADVGHILDQSGVGAIIDLDAIPLHPSLSRLSTTAEQLELAMTAGDDYELCFTIPKQKLGDVNNSLSDIDIAVSVIGEIKQDVGLQWRGTSEWIPDKSGFQHF
ncbi:MAG: thiamine-phosphate kinase [Gammaproteobacteria bacterium]|uniref:Thiamine-monophosphate kinase n=1 Tax=Candidatus Thiopontia autotrophica TaxID=2841688 RepID=A0A8J6TT14_9GAMM|nr:thiamine-phosphate kinase [Candidatus Thiopontia autotrophica]MBL6968635.1 thiamine-phosphate kinase [Gammaproteobacteria bacterium]